MNLLLLNQSARLQASRINSMTPDRLWATTPKPVKSPIWKLLYDFEIYPRLLHHLRSTSTRLHQTVNVFPRCSKQVELSSIEASENWRKLCIIQVVYWVTWARLGPPSRRWQLNTSSKSAHSMNRVVQRAFPLPWTGCSHGRRGRVLVRWSRWVVRVFIGFSMKRALQCRCSIVWRYRIRSLQLPTRSLHSTADIVIIRIWSLTKQKMGCILEKISK